MILEIKAIKQGEKLKTEDGYDKHIFCEGSREHVLYWDSNGTHCTHKNCIVNKDHQSHVSDSIFIKE